MKTEKVVTGMIVGAVVALIAIPATRKVIFETLSKVRDTLKQVKGAAEEMNSVATT